MVLKNENLKKGIFIGYYFDGKIYEKRVSSRLQFSRTNRYGGKLYCECYVPVSIDKWYEQIKVSSEMNALLLQLYRKTGQLEGVLALMDSWELECVNNLIDRKNIACYYKSEYQAIELTDYFDRMHDNKFIQAEIKAIDFFSEFYPLWLSLLFLHEIKYMHKTV